MRTAFYLFMLSVFLASRCPSEEISENGLIVTIPLEWQQLHLGSEYRGVGAYCDAGIVEILIERLPFDEETRTDDLARQISSCREIEQLESFGCLRGRGFKVSGRTAEGVRMSYVVFYPDRPALRVAILVITGEASEQQLAEAKAIASSLREAND